MKKVYSAPEDSGRKFLTVLKRGYVYDCDRMKEG